MRREDIKDETIIEVYNDYVSRVGYKLDKTTRTWDMNSSKRITVGELHELFNLKGGRILLKEGRLLVKDSGVREYLGLEPLDKYNPVKEEISKMIKEKDNHDKLEEVLQYCLDSTLEKIVHLAIEIPVEDLTKANLISSYSGTNVLSVIEQKKEEKEEQKPKDSPSTDSDGKPIRKKVVK